MGLYCAISECTGSHDSKHRFPNPAKFPNMFKKWLTICARPELLLMAPETVYANCRVCRRHFTDDCFPRNNILQRSAYPTLNLPRSVTRTEVGSKKVTVAIPSSPKENPVGEDNGAADFALPSTSTYDPATDNLQITPKRKLAIEGKEDHVKLQIFQLLSKTLIFNYIKQINCVMNGKDLRVVTDSDPVVFRNAKMMYLKSHKK